MKVTNKFVFLLSKTIYLLFFIAVILTTQSIIQNIFYKIVYAQPNKVNSVEESGKKKESVLAAFTSIFVSHTPTPTNTLYGVLRYQR